MTPRLRFSIAAAAFLLGVPISFGILLGWHPVWQLGTWLGMQSHPGMWDAPAWFDGLVWPAAFVQPVAGFVLSLAAVIASLRGKRIPVAAPALTIVAAAHVVVGAAAIAILALVGPDPRFTDGGWETFGLDPYRSIWIALHFVPLLALRPRLAHWLPVSVGIALIWTLIFAAAHHQQFRGRAAESTSPF